MRHVANLVTMPPQSATLCMAAPPPTGPSPDQRRRSRLPCGPAGKPSLPRPPSGPRGPYCSAAVSNLRRGREPEFRLGRCWTSGQGRGRCAGAAGPTTATPGSSDLKMRERRETCAVVRSSPRRGIGGGVCGVSSLGTTALPASRAGPAAFWDKRAGFPPDSLATTAFIRSSAIGSATCSGRRAAPAVAASLGRRRSRVGGSMPRSQSRSWRSVEGFAGGVSLLRLRDNSVAGAGSPSPRWPRAISDATSTRSGRIPTDVWSRPAIKRSGSCGARHLCLGSRLGTAADAPPPWTHPDGRRLGVRAEVGRFPGDRLDRGRPARTQPRGWNMTALVPELASLPRGLVLDGELVAFNEHGAPHWPLLCERVLHGNLKIPVTFVAFDLLAVDGHDVTGNPWSQRRTLLEGIWVERPVPGSLTCSTTGTRCSRRSSSTGWRGSSRSAAMGLTDPASAAGRRSRTRRTGGAIWRSRRCGAAANEGDRNR